MVELVERKTRTVLRRAGRRCRARRGRPRERPARRERGLVRRARGVSRAGPLDLPQHRHLRPDAAPRGGRHGGAPRAPRRPRLRRFHVLVRRRRRASARLPRGWCTACPRISPSSPTPPPPSRCSSAASTGSPATASSPCATSFPTTTTSRARSPPRGVEFVEADCEAFRDAVTPRTRLVALSTVNYTTGLRPPLEELGRLPARARRPALRGRHAEPGRARVRPRPRARRYVRRARLQVAALAQRRRLHVREPRAARAPRPRRHRLAQRPQLAPPGRPPPRRARIHRRRRKVRRRHARLSGALRHGRVARDDARDRPASASSAG